MVAMHFIINLRRGDRDQLINPLKGMVVYVLIVVICELVVIAIGLVLDRTFPLASLPISLTLFFAVLWLGWPLAVRWTDPKRAKHPKLSKTEIAKELRR